MDVNLNLLRNVWNKPFFIYIYTGNQYAAPTMARVMGQI